MTEQFLNGRVTLHEGDCLEAMAQIAENSIDACVCDPPYHLQSIHKRFAAKGRDETSERYAAGPYGRHAKGFMGKAWDGGDVAFQPETWAAVYRVLKPGAHLLAFGGTRNYHRLVCAIEDAGFEVRNCIVYAFGSGFPKNLDVSKAIDQRLGAEREVIGFDRSKWRDASNYKGEKYSEMSASHYESKATITTPATDLAAQWSGWGTSLKPGYEPILCARKPLTLGPSLDTVSFDTQNLIGGVLCPLLLSANNADRLFESNQNVSAQVCASALLIVAVLRGSQSAEWREQMATFNSPEMVSTCLSIVSSWNAIWGVISDQTNTFTTSTAIGLTTTLKTLNLCLSTLIPACIIRAVSSPLGELCDAQAAAGISSAMRKSLMLTQEHIAHVIASLRLALSSASDAEQNFMAAARAANFVLKHALIELQTTNAETNLTPNIEQICLARKPLSEGTIAANVLRWGTGALNIDGCRIASNGDVKPRGSCKLDTNMNDGWARPWMEDRDEVRHRHDAAIDKANMLGRWPANLIHDGSDEVVAAFPDAPGQQFATGPQYGDKKSVNVYGDYGPIKEHEPRNDSGSAARFFASFNGRDGEASADRRYTEEGATNFAALPGARRDGVEASRLFYTSKADFEGRAGSSHPTVKPLDLIQYLCRLICPPGGVVLDCFAGTGTTGEAAFREGFRAVLIEREAQYVADIRRRMALVLAGPNERSRESIKARGLVESPGPLFDAIKDR
jgi:DNA modification methylase